MDHRIDLAGGWSVWRTIGLRGAGFAAAGVLDLAASSAAAAADRWSEAVAALEHARADALGVCGRALDEAPPEHRKRYKAALREARTRAPAPFPEATDAMRDAFASLARAEQAAADLRGAFAAAFDAGALATSEHVRAWAREPRFREAVLWQNRRALATALDILGPASAHANSKTRKHERLVVSYLQRYCVKNDSIGFFGPIGWASFGSHTRVAPGRSLLATRRVYFEYWAMAKVADHLIDDPALRIAIAPRRMPTVTVEGTTLHHPIDRTNELPPAFARLLAACDGERSAADIANELAADPDLELSGVEEVYELLGELVEQRLATWRIELPIAGVPDASLRTVLARVDDAEPRQRALAILDELERYRAAIADARGEAALAHAMSAHEAKFTEITGAEATQHAGQTYAARTIVYEDCRRDAEVVLGAEHLTALAPPLALMLQSARWYTHAVAARYRQALDAAYDELCTAGAEPPIDYIRFWTHISPLLERTNGEIAIVSEINAELQRRWTEVLGPLEGARVSLRAADLRDAVHRGFAAPHPGWPSARHHAPDLMIAGALDNATFVLGELHVSMNTLFVPVFLNQHPHPERLVDAMAADLPDARVTPVGQSERATRADQASLAHTAVDLEVGPTKSGRPRADVIAIGELVVERVADRLVVRTRDGRRSFDIIEFLDHLLVEATLGQFRMLPPLAHSPRVTIDALVASRERWTFTPDELAFLAIAEPPERFAAARVWARTHGLPRFVFYKVPEEPKPCYLDFESPAYVELFARIARGASRIVITEMLPAVDECWLEDAEGRRYASELRVVAVDAESWRP
jgi:hypothetical protein